MRELLLVVVLSVFFYEQLARSLPKGTIISIGEGEPLLEKLLQGKDISQDRCFIIGSPPRPGLIHEQPKKFPKKLLVIIHIFLQYGHNLTGT